MHKAIQIYLSNYQAKIRAKIVSIEDLDLNAVVIAILEKDSFDVCKDTYYQVYLKLIIY